MPQQVYTNVITGARAQFRVGNNIVAYATDVSVEEEISHEPINTFDKVEVQEYAPTGYTVRLTAGFFRTIYDPGTNTPPGSASAPSGQYGSLKGKGIFPRAGIDTKNAIAQPEMTVVLYDKYSNKAIATVIGVKAENKNFQLRARQVGSENVRFNAIRVMDETESAPAS